VVPAYVREYTDSEAAKALAADNLTRKDLSDFEIFKQLNVLFAHGYVKSNSEASHLLGRTRQDIIRYQAFGKMPAEVIELLEANPKLLGASTAKTLADWVDAGHEAAVIQGCLDLANNKLKTQVALVERLIANSKEVPARAPSWGFNITDTNGRAIGKVSITNNSIRITGSGLNFAEIETLLRRELPDCKLD
jgi:ParB family chromosome partitioning protein